MGHSEESGESRPSVAAYFAEPDETAVPFLAALGHVVLAAAALEGNLRLELARLLIAAHASGEGNPDKAPGDQLAALEAQIAGLLGKLREQGLPENLERRIDDAIARRNQLVHHIFEDPQLVKGMSQKEAADAAIGQLQLLALDCAALSVELQAFALPKMEALMGASREELFGVHSLVRPFPS